MSSPLPPFHIKMFKTSTVILCKFTQHNCTNISKVTHKNNHSQYLKPPSGDKSVSDRLKCYTFFS